MSEHPVLAELPYMTNRELVKVVLPSLLVKGDKWFLDAVGEEMKLRKNPGPQYARKERLK